MLSVIILTKNEEKNILDCLESVSWADEIIIIDDYSTDLTLEVVKHFSHEKKLKVYKNRLENNFSAQRNYGLSKAKNDWVLFVDADERISKDLRNEINNFIINIAKNGKTVGCYIKRVDIMWGKILKHGEVGDIKLLRFAKKDAGKWKGNVHENWDIKNGISEFNSFIYHYPHQTITEFLKEINLYTTIRAKELFDQNIKTNIKQIIFYPKAKFIINYFFKLGFLDGLEGLILAILMSFHSFLVRSKLWLLWENK